MNEFEKLLSDLKEHIKELEKTFIRGFILDRKKKPEKITYPDEYEQHVKAYCVLCHAALEQYFEDIAREVMNQYLKEWTNSGKYTDTLVTFVSHYGDEFLCNVKKNNRISPRHLKRLLIPVAIDIPDDPNLTNSLNKLVQARGDYVHTRTKRVVVPEAARDYVQDWLELCEDVKTKAENKLI